MARYSPLPALLAVASLVCSTSLAQFTQDPPGPHDPNTIKTCTWWQIADQSATTKCQTYFGALVDFTSFLAYNPSVDAKCNGVIVGNYYCVENNYGIPDGTAPTTTTTAAPSPSDGPPPDTQEGQPADCNKWHYVLDKELCSTIAAKYNLPLAAFLEWNPAAGSNCENLWANVNVCVGRASVTITVPAPTPTPTPNGPQPQQPGQPTDCNAWYLAKAGDNCAIIAPKYSLTVAQVIAWNPAFGEQCTGLWPEYYVCVGRKSVTITTPTPTPTPTPNGPQPQQPGQPADCNAWYFAKAGDTCAAIASKYSLTVAQVLSWNPGFGSDCGGLWPEYYVCVGRKSVTITTVAPTPTPTPNGPQPQQSGQPADCNGWYLAKKTDTCATISALYSLTVAQFVAWNPAVGSSCTNLWPEYYVCINRKSVTVTKTTSKPTTTTKATGPTPTQFPVVSNCNKYHFVQSGQICETIATMYGITVANIKSWNPGNTCTNMWANVYICVGIK